MYLGQMWVWTGDSSLYSQVQKVLVPPRFIYHGVYRLSVQGIVPRFLGYGIGYAHADITPGNRQSAHCDSVPCLSRQDSMS